MQRGKDFVDGKGGDLATFVGVDPILRLLCPTRVDFALIGGVEALQQLLGERDSHLFRERECCAEDLVLFLRNRHRRPPRAVEPLFQYTFRKRGRLQYTESPRFLRLHVDPPARGPTLLKSSRQ